jgi:hypothetical protein
LGEDCTSGGKRKEIRKINRSLRRRKEEKGIVEDNQ